MAEPKVRFKKDDGSSYPAWRTVTIGEILEKQSIPVNVKKEAFYREIGIRSHGKGLFHKEPVKGFELGNKRVFEIVPDCLVLNIVFAWERAVSKTTNDEDGMIASALTLDSLNVMVIGAACQYGTQGMQVDFIGQFFFSKEDAARALKVPRYRVKVLGQDALQLIFPALALADSNTRMAALVAYQISIADTSVLCAANPHLFRKII